MAKGYDKSKRSKEIDDCLDFIYKEPIGYHQGALLRGRPFCWLGPRLRRLLIKEKNKERNKLGDLVMTNRRLVTGRSARRRYSAAVDMGV